MSAQRLDCGLGGVLAVEEVWDPDVESSTLGDGICDDLWVGDKTEDVREEDDGLVLGIFLVGTLGEVGTILVGAFGRTWKPISRGTVGAAHSDKILSLGWGSWNLFMFSESDRWPRRSD